jgi:hypothetical protein
MNTTTKGHFFYTSHKRRILKQEPRVCFLSQGTGWLEGKEKKKEEEKEEKSPLVDMRAGFRNSSTPELCSTSSLSSFPP